jgi:SAM-dependent methyltransferase
MRYNKNSLNLGCGRNILESCVNLDIIKREGVDVVHDLNRFPYPFDDDSFKVVYAEHVIEHLCPMNKIKFMNEVWRVLEPEGILNLSVPVAGSWISHQDPTHCTWWGDMTAQYFDLTSPYYKVYEPRPWKLIKQERETVRKEGLDISIPLDCLEMCFEKKLWGRG